MTDDEILEHNRSIANSIVSKLNNISKPDSVTHATELLLRHIVRSGDSLTVLCNNSPHNYFFSGAVILRAIYDAMLQALYMLWEPTECENRAKLYLDYYWIEKVRMIETFEHNPTDLAQRFKLSPKRPDAEPEIMKKYESVKNNYLTKKRKLRMTWYKGNLRALASCIGYEKEYEIFQKQLSGVMHSSPLSLKEKPLYDSFLLRDLSWRFSFRVLGKFAEYKGVVLTEDGKGLIDLSYNNIYLVPVKRQGESAVGILMEVL